MNKIIQEIPKIAPWFAMSVTFYKMLMNFSLSKKLKLRKNYKFTKEFLKEIAKPDSHPYLVEKGFEAATGKNNFTALEIIYLLSQPNPSLSIKRFEAATRYVKYCKRANCINFRDNYQNKKKRKRLKKRNIVAYFICAFIAFSPLYFVQHVFNKNWPQALFFIIAFLAGFGPLAIAFLLDARRIDMAEKLIEEQKMSEEILNECELQLSKTS